MEYKRVKTLELCLTEICNLKCPACERFLPIVERNFDFARKNGINTFLDFKHLKGVIEKLDIEKVLIMGSHGEPTLHPQFFKIIEYLKEKDIKIFISTNGTTHNKKWWYKLGTLTDNRDMVMFSIDGVNQKSYERYRIGGSLSKILDHHREYKKKGSKSQWQFIIFEHNKNDVDDAHKMSVDNNFDSFISIHTRLYKGDNVKSTDEMIEIYKAVKNLIDKKYETKNVNISCKGIQSESIVVDAYGFVSPCCHWQDDIIAGTEYEKDIDKIMEYSLYKHNIEDILYNNYNEVFENIPKGTYRTCITNCDKFVRNISEMFEIDDN